MSLLILKALHGDSLLVLGVDSPGNQLGRSGVGSEMEDPGELESLGKRHERKRMKRTCASVCVCVCVCVCVRARLCVYSPQPFSMYGACHGSRPQYFLVGDVSE